MKLLMKLLEMHDDIEITDVYGKNSLEYVRGNTQYLVTCEDDGTVIIESRGVMRMQLRDIKQAYKYIRTS